MSSYFRVAILLGDRSCRQKGRSQDEDLSRGVGPKRIATGSDPTWSVPANEVKGIGTSQKRIRETDTPRGLNEVMLVRLGT